MLRVRSRGAHQYKACSFDLFQFVQTSFKLVGSPTARSGHLRTGGHDYVRHEFCERGLCDGLSSLLLVAEVALHVGQTLPELRFRWGPGLLKDWLWKFSSHQHLPRKRELHKRPDLSVNCRKGLVDEGSPLLDPFQFGLGILDIAHAGCCCPVSCSQKHEVPDLNRTSLHLSFSSGWVQELIFNTLLRKLVLAKRLQGGTLRNEREKKFVQ